MQKKQESLTIDNIFIGVAMFMYICNQDRMSQITGQIRTINKKPDNRLTVTVSDKTYLCKYNKTAEGLNVTYENDFVSIKSLWNPGCEIFKGEINGKQVDNIKIAKEGRIGNYVFQYMNSEVFVTVRLPKNSEFEKFIPVIEKTSTQAKTNLEIKETVDKKTTDSLDEQIAVAIAIIKSKN